MYPSTYYFPQFINALKYKNIPLVIFLLQFQMLKEKYKFTLEVLSTIIQKELTLYQYYDHLHQILKSIPTHYNDNKLHHQIITNSDSSTNTMFKFYLVDSEFSVCSSQVDDQGYQYNLIEQTLNSKQFITKLYPNVNSLLTTTNIGIAKQTLLIYMLMDTNIQKTRALTRIKQTINILTLHQRQKSINSLICSLDQLNKIFNNIGLIITQNQYLFYYHELWDDLPEQITIQDCIYQHTCKEIPKKNLRIYHLLALSVEMMEIQVLKNNLKQWLGSDEYRKNYTKSKKYTKKNSNILYHEIQEKSKQILEQNINVAKLKIQQMNPSELLQEISKRQYNVDEHYKKYMEYRKNLLHFYDKQQKKKKVFNTIHQKNIENLNGISKNEYGLLHKQNTNNKLNKLNNNTNSSPKIKSIVLSGDARRQMQSKLEQQAFNLKLLNGVYLREQIMEDVQQNNVDFVQDWEDSASNEQSEENQINNQILSITSKNNKFTDFVEQDNGKQNQKQPKQTNKYSTIKQKYKSTMKILQTKSSNGQTKKVINTLKMSKKKQNSIHSQISILDKTCFQQKFGNDKPSVLKRMETEGFLNLGEKIMKK